MGSLSYRRLFLQMNPEPPWECFFCHESVLDLGRTRLSLNVHHVDHDPTNNDLRNLVATHLSCHKSHHGFGRTATEETRKRRSESLQGHSVSPETRRKISEATTGRVPSYGRLGKKHSDEARAKMSIAAKRRVSTPEGEEHMQRIREKRSGAA